MEGLTHGDGQEARNAGVGFDPNSLAVGETGVDGQAPTMSDADLAKLLAAFGSS